jgi:hypothetical protein
MHAVVITPAGSAEAVRSYSSIDIGLPHVFAGSAPASNGFVACSTFTRVTTCMLTESPSDPLHQRLQQFRYLHYRFDCYRMERTRFRAALIPLKNSAFHGARKRTFGWQAEKSSNRSLDPPCGRAPKSRGSDNELPLKPIPVSTVRADEIH